MKPIDIIQAILGVGLVVLGATVPTATAVAIPVGVGMIAHAAPQLSALLGSVPTADPAKTRDKSE